MTAFTVSTGINRRPGVQVRQNVIDVIPASLTNHAIAYMYVSVPGDQWDSDPDFYTSLVPLEPTIINSPSDYLARIGGTVPNPVTDYEAFISYKSVVDFFNTSGGNGVLYVIRTAITPTVQIALDDTPETNSANWFVIKIDGVYYGTLDLGFQDSEGVQVLALPTTGIDLADNAFDIVAFLRANSFFDANYEILDDPTNIALGIITINSKTFGSIPDVQSLLTTPLSGSLAEADLISAGTITRLTNQRELNFKLNLEETIIRVPAVDFDPFFTDLTAGAFTELPNTVLDDEIFSVILNNWIAANVPGYTLSGTLYTAGTATGLGAPLAEITPANFTNFRVALHYDDPTDTYTPVMETAGAPMTTRDTDDYVQYYEAVLNGASEPYWTPLVLTDPTDFTPKSVQIYSVNIGDPSNRFVLTSNGATLPEHSDDFLPKLEAAIDDDFYVLTQKYNLTSGAVEWGGDTIEGVANGHSFTVPSVVDTNLYSWDLVQSFQIESLISAPLYIWNGTNSQGNPEENFFNYLDDTLGLAAGNATAAVTDYVYTITNSLDDPNLLPGFLLIPEAYARYSTAISTSTAAVLRQNRLSISSALNQVATEKDWFALIDDDPDSLNSQQSSQEFDALVNTVGSPLGHMGFYYPHIIDLDNRLIPASPYVAGVALARYGNEGFRQPPAGINYPLVGALRPKFVVSQSQQEINSPRGMNPILTFPNAGVVIFGARTTVPDTPVQFVNSRIIANVVLQSLKNSFDGFVFNAIETVNAILFDRISVTATAILQELFEGGALIGQTATDAYLVICDSRNNSDANLAQGIVFCYIEFAPASTSERIVIDVNITSAGQVGANITTI